MTLGREAEEGDKTSDIVLHDIGSDDDLQIVFAGGESVCSGCE